MDMDEFNTYETARKRVAEKKKFYGHLSTYLVMSVFFFVLNWLTSPGSWWFYWPMLGWGIGVAMQYLRVFGMPGSGLGSREWEDQEIEKEMRRIAPAQPDTSLDMDEHLELREMEKQKSPQPRYRSDDLV
ncbi:MAG: hypothetical protein DA408_02805 [Bacteroidetes bacterium]|nr:MAG: hypothetical protein C7N36_17390 [Bacteroidota bacterium]PTM14530.1 MAG: hypothetical protein DA408_02805 [Bacteroidota bacterium]